MSVQDKLLESCGASKQEIIEYADAIAEHLKFQPGDDLELLVNRLKGEIEDMESDGSGQACITVNEDGSFIIRLFPFLFPLQRRLSIAHELGHLFLHSRYGEIPIEAFHDAENEDDLVEDEAHYFACAFLMPRKEFRKAAMLFGRDTVGIAAEFMVPEPIVRQMMQDVS